MHCSEIALIRSTSSVSSGPDLSARCCVVHDKRQIRTIKVLTSIVTSNRPLKWRRSRMEKHLQRIQQRLRIVLALINRRRCGAALEQDIDRLPRRADRALEGESYFLGALRVF